MADKCANAEQARKHEPVASVRRMSGTLAQEVKRAFDIPLEQGDLG